jgi:hypothetical protein
MFRVRTPLAGYKVLCSPDGDCVVRNRQIGIKSWQLSKKMVLVIFFIWCTNYQWARASSFTKFLDHTQQHTTVGRTPLDKWSARRIDIYLTTYNTQNRHSSMPPEGIEPTISSGEWPQTYSIDCAVTGTGRVGYWLGVNKKWLCVLI